MSGSGEPGNLDLMYWTISKIPWLYSITTGQAPTTPVMAFNTEPHDKNCSIACEGDHIRANILPEANVWIEATRALQRLFTRLPPRPASIRVDRFRRPSVTRGQASPHRATRSRSVAKRGFPKKDPRNKATSPTRRHSEAEHDEGRSVVDQALALEHNQDPVNVFAIAT